MTYNPKDFYFKKAKAENYAARSVFKLEEIDRRHRILKSADKVLDLGAAPGSWSQFASKKIGLKGRVLGIDLQPIKLTIPNCVFVVGDMRQVDLADVLKEYEFSPPFQVVLSDMAPKTIGIKITDQVRSFELCMIALEVARKYLAPHGHFVCKLFNSGEFEEMRGELRKYFKQVEVLRPESTRKQSKEVFLIGKDFKGSAP